MSDFMKKCSEAGWAFGRVAAGGDEILTPEHVALCLRFVEEYSAIMSNDDLSRYCRALCRSHENLRITKLLEELR